MNSLDFEVEHSVVLEALQVSNAAFSLFVHVIASDSLTNEQKSEFAQLQSTMSEDIPLDNNMKYSIYDVLDAYILGAYLGYCKGLSTETVDE